MFLKIIRLWLKKKSYIRVSLAIPNRNDSYAAKRNQNSSAGTQDRAVYSEPVTRSAPPAPYVPPRPSGAAIERKVDPAEEAYAKALEKQLELKAKANESPIRFELNKDN